MASVTVDGILSAGEYGPATAAVTYNALAPNSNFGSPTGESDAIGYSIYLNATAGMLYGLLQTNPAGGGCAVGSFANLYFDLDPQNGNGSDLGFEVTNSDAFIPGVGSPVAAPGLVFSTTASTVEFGIPIADFTGPIAGLNYYPGHTFPDANNPNVVLRLSQSFGYSVAGGSATYGTNRLGSVNVIAAVPEPATIMVLGAGLLALAGVRRRRA